MTHVTGSDGHNAGMRASPLTRLRCVTIWMLLGLVLVVWSLLVVTVADRGPVAIVLVTVLAAATVRLMLRAMGTVYGHWLDIAVGVMAAAVAFPLIRQVDERPAALLWSMAAGLFVVSLALLLSQGWRVAATVIGLAGILMALWLSGFPIGVAGLMAGSALMIAGGVGMQWWTYEVAKRLEEARVVVAELAVAEERLRFAAELHDIQGHHLQVIALKSELAARVADRDKAIELMREVQQLAREALTDTRAVVGGYRKVTLGTELANAVKVLAAAGVAAAVEAAAEVEGAAERLLGLVVREATTNILRHAQASKATLRLTVRHGEASLTVVNDGAADAGEGGGLRTLAERVEAAGGRLSWGSAQGRFTVHAVVPTEAAS